MWLWVLGTVGPGDRNRLRRVNKSKTTGRQAAPFRAVRAARHFPLHGGGPLAAGHDGLQTCTEAIGG